MKKTIASLALAGLATLAFGQTAPAATPAPLTPTVTFGAYLNTGVSILANGQDTALYGLYGEENQDYKNGGKYKLLGTFDLNGNGLTFDAQTDGADFGGSSTYGALYLKYAYAYTNSFNNVLTAKVGIIDEQTNRTQGDAQISFTHNVPGAEVIVRPVSGLTLNAGVTDAAILNSTSTTAPATNAGSVGDFYDTYSVVGGSYTFPGVGAVMGEVQLDVTKAPSNTYNLGKAYAGVNITAVPNLSAWFEFLEAGYNGGNLGGTGSDSLNDGKYDGFSTYAETVSYNFKDLGAAPATIGLIAYQFLYDTGLKTAGSAVNASLKFTPWVSYDLTSAGLTGVVPKLSFTYFSGAEILAGSYSQAKMTSTNGQDNVLGQSAAILPAGTSANNVAEIMVAPSVRVNLAKNQYLNFIYTFVDSIGSSNVTYLSNNSSATSLSIVQADYFFQF